MNELDGSLGFMLRVAEMQGDLTARVVEGDRDWHPFASII